MIVTHTEREREREREAEGGRGRSRLHAPGARRGIRSRVSRITPWAKGRRQTTMPPRDPCFPIFKIGIRTVSPGRVTVRIEGGKCPTQRLVSWLCIYKCQE